MAPRSARRAEGGRGARTSFSASDCCAKDDSVLTWPCCRRLAGLSSWTGLRPPPLAAATGTGIVGTDLAVNGVEGRTGFGAAAAGRWGGA